MRQDEPVSGRTRLYGIIGDPIEQVRSPTIITAEFHARGVDALLVPVHAPAECFDTVMTGLKAIGNLDGLVLTIPFKSRALDHADEIGPEGMAGGGVNAMIRRADGTWFGEMFDGLGCLAALAAAGHSVEGRRVLLVGAGGAGSAIGIAAARRNPAFLRVAEIDADRARTLLGRIRAIAPGLDCDTGAPDPDGFDVVLNATPLGMENRPESPLSAPVSPGTLVFDAVPYPAETRMMAEARENGAIVVGGAEMIRGQVGLIVDFFLANGKTQEKDMT